MVEAGRERAHPVGQVDQRTRLVIELEAVHATIHGTSGHEAEKGRARDGERDSGGSRQEEAGRREDGIVR